GPVKHRESGVGWTESTPRPSARRGHGTGRGKDLSSGTMSEGTKRPRATEPPRQGGGFVTGGEDAWTQQDPDTWAKMGSPNATPLRPADEKRREEGGNGKHDARPPRGVISGPPSRPPSLSTEAARLFTRVKGNEDDPSTVVGSTRTTPSAPKPGVARIEGARMEIVNFD